MNYATKLGLGTCLLCSVLATDAVALVVSSNLTGAGAMSSSISLIGSFQGMVIVAGGDTSSLIGHSLGA